MTETVGAARDKAKDNPLTDLAHSEAADRLKSEAQEYLSAQAQRVLAGLGRKLGQTTSRLNDIAEGNSPGFAKLALDGGRKLAEGKGPLRTAVELGASRVKENVMGAVKNLGGGGKGRRKGGGGNKPTVIMESIDVGVPLRTAYDQWTQYQDFSTFAKGVKSANRADDTTSDWQAKVFWSNRSWKAHTTEQLPDHRIQWTSEGAKGTTKGVITFHPLGENLTRVLLVMEYYPSGLFEKTGNIWRAQGRRARLDLKNFARFISLKGEAQDGWRGEIRDGEVVRSHEDAVAEEEEQQAQDARDSDAEDSRSGASDEEASGEDVTDEEAGEDEDGAPEAEADEEAGEDEDAEYEDTAYEDEDAEDGEEDAEEGPYAEDVADAEDDEDAEVPEEEEDEEYEDAADAEAPADEDEDEEEVEYEEEEEPEYAERGSRR
ncbi:SRPBCC family protein [Streptomyces sp. TG1A-8]|uniref:SRPBCC family protein n=1 Tax=Streptomyces sp. TG1A-8 TaxID=3051385 RepID=UPI00265C4802|nr:SRPBCC family protein [Streptomyces sp. TG1A-8]MDO0924897.1 SRPBCC family protein [Streptomyces sp. TG1A-8]